MMGRGVECSHFSLQRAGMVSYLENEPDWKKVLWTDPRNSNKLIGSHSSNNNSADASFITSNNTSSPHSTSISLPCGSSCVEGHTVLKGVR